MSVSLQLVANGGEPEGLFCGAIMQSGAALPVGGVTLGQKHYDDLVLRTSCLHAENTLDCLRHTPIKLSKLRLTRVWDFSITRYVFLSHEARCDPGGLTR